MARWPIPLLLLVIGASGCGDAPSPTPVEERSTPTSRSAREEAEATREILNALSNFVARYAADHDGSLPESVEDLLGPDPDGTPTIGAVPVDAWGRGLRFSPRADGSFGLRSAGADGVMDTDDDLVLGE